MTRETKVGMVVGSTFVCLLSVVIISKLRPPEPPLDGFEPSEPQIITPSPVAQASSSAPSAPAPKQTNTPPMLSLGNGGAPAVLPKRLPEPKGRTPAEPLVPAAILPPLTQMPPLVNAPAPNGDLLPAKPAPLATAPLMTPLPEALAEPKPFVGPLPEPRTMAQGDVGLAKSQLPSASSSDPLSATLPAPGPIARVELPKASGKIELPAPVPVAAQEPKITFPAPAPTAPEKSKPMPMPAPITLAEDKKDPIAMPPLPRSTDPIRIEPAPTPVALPEVKAPPLVKAPPAVVPPAVVPLAKAPLAVAPPLTVQEKTPVPPPLTASAPAPAPKRIGTIGTSGNEVNLPPVVIGPSRTQTALVPALAASGRELPKVTSHTDDVRITGPADASFAQLSQQYYGSTKYASALLEYNRQHLLNRSNANLQRNPPLLQPNQAIFYPKANVLESQYRQLVQAVPALGGTAPVVQISPPMPLITNVASATPPTADPTVNWTVRQTQHIFAIAQQTLGNGSQWTEILRLNPTLRTDQPIPAGTQLRLPATARIN